MHRRCTRARHDGLSLRGGHPGARRATESERRQGGGGGGGGGAEGRKAGAAEGLEGWLGACVPGGGAENSGLLASHHSRPSLDAFQQLSSVARERSARANGGSGASLLRVPATPRALPLEYLRLSDRARGPTRASAGTNMAAANRSIIIFPA